MSVENIPKVFLDTDVAFDILSKREPHYSISSEILRLAVEGKIQMYVSYSCIPNLIYLGYDIYKLKGFTSILTDFISACSLIQTQSKQVVLHALNSNFKDKEDALQYFTALHHGVDYFLTRNQKDYKHSSPALPVYSPKDFQKII